MKENIYLTPKHFKVKKKEIEFSIEYLEDKAALDNSKYQKIFLKTIREDNYLPWKRGILKITNNKISIYRRYIGANISFENKGDEISLSSLSLRMLNIKRNDKVVVKAAPKIIGIFLFYWYHPLNNERVAFKFTFICTIVSIILSSIIGAIVGKLIN